MSETAWTPAFDRHRSENIETVLDALEALERLCFSDPWSREAFRQTLAGTQVSLLTLGEEIEAYLLFLGVAPEGEILNLAVHPKRRRQGLASHLMQALDVYCRAHGIDTLYLEVRASNTAALTLYEKEGFVRTGVRRRYYRHPTEDAILMVKTLTE